MKIKYIAYDDTEFSSKEECERYEKAHEKMVSEIIGLNGHYERITDFWDGVSYIFAPSKDSINFLSNQYGIEGLSVGWNIYDEDFGLYDSFEILKEEAESQYSYVKETEEILKGFSQEKKTPEYDVFYTTDFVKGHLEMASFLDLPEVLAEINKYIDKNDNNIDIRIRRK